MPELITCQCRQLQGSDDRGDFSCRALATQEDFLCDVCRDWENRTHDMGCWHGATEGLPHYDAGQPFTPLREMTRGIS